MDFSIHARSAVAKVHLLWILESILFLRENLARKELRRAGLFRARSPVHDLFPGLVSDLDFGLPSNLE